LARLVVPSSSTGLQCDRSATPRVMPDPFVKLLQRVHFRPPLRWPIFLFLQAPCKHLPSRNVASQREGCARALKMETEHQMTLDDKTYSGRIAKYISHMVFGYSAPDEPNDLPEDVQA